MDLNTVRTVRQPRARAELGLSGGETFLAGGTWLYSEPQPDVTGVVDLMSLGWPSLTVSADGLEIAATCTLAELLRLDPPASWRAAPLFGQCVNSLVASFKIFHLATVGGNLCTTLPAGSIIALTAALDGVAVIWTPDGGERSLPVTDFVLGAQRNALAPGELLRSVRIGVDALKSYTAHRKTALTSLGRSGSLVVGRLGGDGSFVLTVTGATDRPRQFRHARLPDAETLSSDLDGIELWYDDPHGSPRWREHMTRLLAEEIRQELGEKAGAA
jgi:CO/xanthine dehydrogenase FAD-binding subunit